MAWEANTANGGCRTSSSAICLALSRRIGTLQLARGEVQNELFHTRGDSALERASGIQWRRDSSDRLEPEESARHFATGGVLRVGQRARPGCRPSVLQQIH